MKKIGAADRQLENDTLAITNVIFLQARKKYKKNLEVLTPTTFIAYETGRDDGVGRLSRWRIFNDQRASLHTRL